MRAAFLAALLGVLVASACSDEHAPRLHDLSFAGQAPESDLVLIFTVGFEDPDGDLGRGVLETFVNERPSGLGPLSLEPIFLWSRVPLDATFGEIEFVLELSLDEAPSDGTEFKLGVRVLDEQAHVSNVADIVLRVEPR